MSTNVIITPNQTRGICVEDPLVTAESRCNESEPSGKNGCEADKPLLLGDGIETGNCNKTYLNGTSACEIEGWCPTERGILPLKNDNALLKDTKNFTVLIKNTVQFLRFGVSRRNILDKTNNKTYLQGCHYDSESNPFCPVFVLGDVVKKAGEDYDEIAKHGGVIAIEIKWDCNLDRSLEKCVPQYHFRRLDDSNAKIAQGWNYRYARYYGDNQRTLFKVYGIQFVVLVSGQGGKFETFIPLLINIGSGLGLLVIVSYFCFKL